MLERFYSRRGVPLPRFTPLPGLEMPQPYRKLLVHSSDMTPTLEAFYHQPMRITVLTRERQDETYWREVVLHRADDATPVEYGVIRICLGNLPAPAARRVLEEQRPLGNILQTEGVAHLSWPQAFFSLPPDAHLGERLGVGRPQALYGRRNVLLDGSRRLLADVLEILAPAAVKDASRPAGGAHSRSLSSPATLL